MVVNRHGSVVECEFVYWVGRKAWEVAMATSVGVDLAVVNYPVKDEI